MTLMKRIFTLGVFLLELMLFACSDDSNDELQQGVPEQDPLSEIEKKFVGGWPELGSSGVTFLKNGIVAYNGKTGHWQYDEDTQILTTDVTDDRGNVLIWQINMLEEGSMVGMQFWNNRTFSAKRDVNQALSDILNCRSWTRDPKGKVLVIEFDAKYKNNGSLEGFKYTYEKYRKSSTFVYSFDDVVITENNPANITIHWPEDDPLDHGDAIIHNPYDFENVCLQFPKGLMYYPETDNMPELEKGNMSNREAMLVGKWICQEQTFVDPEYPDLNYSHIYLDDEYGVEFFSDFWCEVWAGRDELLEDGGGHRPSWWIKEDMLYFNSTENWRDDWHIVSLSEKEMILEMHYLDGDITRAKFYKYSEEEGLLGDRLEYVDLGLSVKWATRNLGAEDKNVSLIGNYYAWGETQAKLEYKPENYKFYKQENNQWKRYKLTKYSTSEPDGYEGFVDNKFELDSEDDAARVIRGGNWRMPTPEEWKELIESCSWTWIYDQKMGKSGYKVTGKTGYSIFLPAADYSRDWKPSNEGYYLTNNKIDKKSYNADFPMFSVIHFTSVFDQFKGYPYTNIFHHEGCNIRPVQP